MSFICHIHNYTEYNEEWNVFSAFNPSKYTHTWSSGHTHTHTHTPGAVDTHTHTHTHTWSSGHTHTHLEQWTHTHTHTHGAVGVRPGSSWGFGALLKGLTSVPNLGLPRVSSPTLYPLGHDCPCYGFSGCSCKQKALGGSDTGPIHTTTADSLSISLSWRTEGFTPAWWGIPSPWQRRNPGEQTEHVQESVLINDRNIKAVAHRTSSTTSRTTRGIAHQLY